LHHPLPHPKLHSFPTRRSSDLKTNPASANVDSVVSPTATVLLCTTGTRWIQVSQYRSGSNSLRQNPEREKLPKTLTNSPLTGKRSEEHTSELQSRENLVCRLLL